MMELIKSSYKQEKVPHYSFRSFGIRLKLVQAVCQLVSKMISLVFIHIWSYRKKVILKNLRNAFPLLSMNEISRMMRAYYRHVGNLITESFLLGNVGKENIGEIVSYENLSLIHHLIKEKKDIVLMASHCGNWEYLLSLPLYVKCNVLAPYSPLSNNLLNEKLKKMRSKFGAKLISKSEWYRTAMKWRDNFPTIFAVIADQRPPEISKHNIDFLNQKTYVQSGAARIAQKRSCALVYMDVMKNGLNSYNFRFILISADAEKREENDLMNSYYKMLEKTIRRQPELWLWSHNRWKF